MQRATALSNNTSLGAQLYSSGRCSQARSHHRSRERAAGSITAKGALCCGAPVDLCQHLLDDTGAGFRSRYFKRRFPVENWQIFAKPLVCFFRVAENILSQCLNPRQPHDPIGFFNSQRLSLGLAMPLRALRDYKPSDLLVREATALDINERSQRNAAMNEACKISLRGHLLT